MKRLVSVSAALFLSTSVFAVAPSKPAQSTQPALEIISQTPVGMFKHQATLYRQAIANPGSAPDKAIFIIDLWGGDKTSDHSLAAYHEMGREYGYLLNKANLPAQYQNLSLDGFYTELHNEISKSEWYLGWLYNAITKVSYDRIPAREMQMIAGAAETAGLASETVSDGKMNKVMTAQDKLVFLDQMFLFTFLTHVIPVQSPELQLEIMQHPFNLQTPPKGVEPFGCSTLATWGDYTADHQMLFARNFDWTKSLHPFFANRTLVGVFHPNNGDNSMALIGYPGWFFSDTAMNDKGLILEMNSGWYSSYTMNVTKKTQSYGDLMSDFLFTSNDYNSLYKTVSESTADIGYVIFGTDGKKIFAAEETAPGMLVPKYVRMRTPASQSHYATDPVNEDVMLASNAFRLRDWDKLIGLQAIPYPYPKTDESSSYPLTRYDNLLSQARSNKGQITLNTMKNIMERSLMHGAEGGATGYEALPSMKDAIAVTYFSLVAAPDQNGKLFNWWLRLPAVANQCVDGSKCDDSLGWVNLDLNRFFK
jgi:hypothetical protein